ncbi:hypothetical protein DFH28DRAFT_949216 [Melampsora americana]|nr:hypothetical protein DFH28DRAFT_949216 [Melampsora americana]
MARFFSGINSAVVSSGDVWQVIRSGKNRNEARSEQPCKTKSVPQNKFITLKSTAVVEISYVCVTKYDVRTLRCQPHHIPSTSGIGLPSGEEAGGDSPEPLENTSKDLPVETSASSISQEVTQLPICIAQLADSDLPASSGEFAPVSLVNEHKDGLHNQASNDSILDFNLSNATLVEASPETPNKRASSSPLHSTPFLDFLDASHLEESKGFHEEQVKLSIVDLGCAQFNSAYDERCLPPSLPRFKHTTKFSKPFCWNTRSDEIMKDEESIDLSGEVTEDITTEHDRTLSTCSMSLSSHLCMSSMSSENTCAATPELLAGSFLDQQNKIPEEKDHLSTSTTTISAESMKNIEGNPAPISHSSLLTTEISSPSKSQKSSDPEAFQSLCKETSNHILPQIEGGNRALADTMKVQKNSINDKVHSDSSSSFSSSHLSCISSSSNSMCVDPPNLIFLQRSFSKIVSLTSFVVLCSIIFHFSSKVFLCNLKSIE